MRSPLEAHLRVGAVFQMRPLSWPQAYAAVLAAPNKCLATSSKSRPPSKAT